MSELSFMAFLFFAHIWRNKTMPSREEKSWQHYETAKKMRKVRKEIKRNRKPKRVRHKDWNLHSFDDLDALDELDFCQEERIMPRGEQERRRANLSRALSPLGEDEQQGSEESVSTEAIPGQPGVVVEVSSGLCRVDLGQRAVLCSVRGSLSAAETGYTNVVAVGDEVLISENGSGAGVLEAVLPRRSILTRPDVFHSHLNQIIVANADQLLIVASWRDPHIWLELIDRYLIAAVRCKLQPVICVNKVDLAENVESFGATLKPYRDVGYRIIFTSAVTGKGVGKLRQALANHTTALAGLSGVGKSSLLAAVQPGLQLRTGQVNQQSGEGRHTTTQVMMHRLQSGGFVVDTPGIREFGLSDLCQRGLARFYPEINAVAAGCRFDDCSHIHEPGCAVRAAAQEGRISGTRYDNYTKIHASLPA
jgi:ribosome biogenesis GTPase